MILFPSACLWAYETGMEAALRQIKQTAFHFIDVEHDTLDGPGLADLTKELGLRVSCVALDHRLPTGSSQDGSGSAALGKAAEHLKERLQKCETLGASAAYVAPCVHRSQLQAFGKALSGLADEAVGRGIRLCVEHVPGRALPSARETLSFLEKLGHPGLFLLLDVGHALLSKEDPATIASAAGRKIGYVQMNDNDGKKDRHWPLLDGVLTPAMLAGTLRAVRDAGYEGTLGLELSKDIPSLVSGFSRNRNLLLRTQYELR